MSDSALITLFQQIAVLAICAYLSGELARRAQLPMVVGEILAGVVLGPSILKHLWAGAYQVMVPHSANHPHLTAFSALAVTMLLF